MPHYASRLHSWPQGQIVIGVNTPCQLGWVADTERLTFSWSNLRLLTVSIHYTCTCTSASFMNHIYASNGLMKEIHVGYMALHSTGDLWYAEIAWRTLYVVRLTRTWNIYYIELHVHSMQRHHDVIGAYKRHTHWSSETSLHKLGTLHQCYVL